MTYQKVMLKFPSSSPLLFSKFYFKCCDFTYGTICVRTTDESYVYAASFEGKQISLIHTFCENCCFVIVKSEFKRCVTAVTAL